MSDNEEAMNEPPPQEKEGKRQKKSLNAMSANVSLRLQALRGKSI